MVSKYLSTTLYVLRQRKGQKIGRVGEAIGKRGGLDGGTVSKISLEISDNTLICAAARVRSAESSGMKLKTTSAEGTRRTPKLTPVRLETCRF